MDSILLDPFSLALICVVCAIPVIYVLLYIISWSLYGVLNVLDWLEFLLSKITNPHLIKKIKANPEQAELLIKSYWAKDYLSKEFYKKYAWPSKRFKIELNEAIANMNKTDIIALDRYESLSSEYFKLIAQIRETEKQRSQQQIEAEKQRRQQQAEEQELKRQQEQNLKMEVLANKATQALDEVWD